MASIHPLKTREFRPLLLPSAFLLSKQLRPADLRKPAKLTVFPEPFLCKLQVGTDFAQVFQHTLNSYMCFVLMNLFVLKYLFGCCIQVHCLIMDSSSLFNRICHQVSILQNFY